jgi:hypothetical protein
MAGARTARNVWGRQSRRHLLLGVVVGLLVSTVLHDPLTPRPLSEGEGALSSPRPLHLPRVMLWAWERHEDVRTIDPREVGIAYLAKTLFLRQGNVVTRPRLQPLQVPPATVLMPVIRIESHQLSPPTLDLDQRTRVVQEIVALARVATTPVVQIDFDAKVSERAFYRAVLHDLRRALPDTTRISITALASWCLADNWLAGLPIDEAVPMLFRMGADRQRVLWHLQTGGDVRCLPIQQSLGLAADEPLPHVPSGRRLYVFSTRAWSPASVHSALEEVKRWQ